MIRIAEMFSWVNFYLSRLTQQGKGSYLYQEIKGIIQRFNVTLYSSYQIISYVLVLKY